MLATGRYKQCKYLYIVYIVANYRISTLKSLPRAKEIMCDVYADHTPIPKDGHSSIAIFTDM